MEREKKRTAELSTEYKGSKTDIARRAQKQRSPKDESKRLLKVAATYSPTMQRSTIGDAELNDPVRNGKGWDLSAITT